MKNSNLNNEYLEDEIDLRELFKTILNSKKLIIIVALTFSLLAFIYTSQKELEYQSSVIIEVGSYDLLNGEKKLVEPIPNLIKNLKVDLIYKKQLGILNFNSIEDQLLEINYTSPSPEYNENLIKEAIKFAQESHTEILANIVNFISEKIMAVDKEIEFLKNSIENQENSQKFIENQQISQKLIAAINMIKAIDIEKTALEFKIKYLLELIPAEENNLLLLNSNPSALLLRASSSPTLQQIIYSYNEKIINMKQELQNLNQKKGTLELQVKSIENGEFTSTEERVSIAKQLIYEQLFKLNQDKGTLELQVKLVKDQTNTTQPILEIVTIEIKPKHYLIILIGTIFGFIFSISIVMIRQAFLKKEN